MNFFDYEKHFKSEIWTKDHVQPHTERRVRSNRSQSCITSLENLTLGVQMTKDALLSSNVLGQDVSWTFVYTSYRMMHASYYLLDTYDRLK